MVIVESRPGVYTICSDLCYKEFDMEFVPYRVLRNEPTALRQRLEEEGQLVITVDGRPFAIMIDLGESDNVEDILLMVSRLRAQMAARAIRSQARRSGLDKMPAEEIDDLVRKTRAARKPSCW